MSFADGVTTKLPWVLFAYRSDSDTGASPPHGKACRTQIDVRDAILSHKLGAGLTRRWMYSYNLCPVDF